MEIKLKSDSRKVKEGDTFIAIPNVERDGHDYIPDAIKNGAKKIIAEKGSYEVKTEIVSSTRDYLNNYLFKNYYPKFKSIKLIGVTGTNGKTTTCYLVFQMLKLLKKKCSYIGTIGFYYNDEKRLLNNTTPDIDLLYEMFLEAKYYKCKYMVMEVSSHALDMNRVYGLSFDEVAFTNLTQDHLDYHKTLDNYMAAKKILFTKTRGKKIAVINADDPYYENFLVDNNNNINLGTSGDLKILDIHLTNLDTEFSFSYKGKTYHTKINLVGRYNVYNYLTALLLVHELGFGIKKLLKLNDKLTPPPGRMDMIKFNTNSIFIDYAHTPDAVLNVINSAKEYKKGQIYTILGCGGDRDRTKRPIMGDIATTNSDYVILTNDNPRTEDEKQIMNDILAGVKTKNYEVIFNRKEAIKKGISLLKENDILLILGKGHEDYQIIGHDKIHFSDKEIVLENI